MRILIHINRWISRTFRTRTIYQPDPFGRWTWTVERPDWWTIGATSGVSDHSIPEARRRLDEWQDDQWRRKCAS